VMGGQARLAESRELEAGYGSGVSGGSGLGQGGDVMDRQGML
jgi:hypothetical protein